MLNKGQANFIAAIHYYQNRTYVHYKSHGFVQNWSMVTFFILELPILICIDLMIYDLVLKGPAQLLFNPSFNVDMLLLWDWCVIY